jgi:predicted enzyme related to lactoylglutathione lyase
MLRVIEFAFTGYSVTDVPRARDFYENALNLTPSTVFDHEGKYWIEYEVGPHVLAISNMSEEWKPSPNGGGVALEVEDFDSAITSLKEKGVKFYSEPFASPVCRMALIADPDGNSICIHKRNSA